MEYYWIRVQHDFTEVVYNINGNSIAEVLSIYHEIDKWCAVALGPKSERWTNESGEYRFFNESDLTLFLLRWQ